jgi:hypothetical protein
MSGKVNCCQSYEDAVNSAPPENKDAAKDRLVKCKLYETQSTNDLYATLNSLDENMRLPMAQCIQKRIIQSDEPLVNLINNYESNKVDAVTASEMNKNLMSLYQIDLYYTVGKIFIFLAISLAYYYFLNGQNMVEMVKTGIQNANEKIKKFTDVKAPKIPEVKPEVKSLNSKMPIK